MIKTIETNRESLVCSPERIAYLNKWIDKKTLEEAANLQEKNTYGQYLKKLKR